MVKKYVTLLLVLVMCANLCIPAFATETTPQWYDECTLDDGCILKSAKLDNGNLLISHFEDGKLLDSTETDYESRTLITTQYNNVLRTPATHTTPFDSFLENMSTVNSNGPSINSTATGTFKHFADVSFRAQLGTDHYFTPKAQVYVRTNTPGDEIFQRVRVSTLGETISEVVSAFSLALGLMFPDTGAVKAFIIALGIYVGDKIVTSIDYADLLSTRHGETIKASYGGKSQEYAEGAYIVASGDTSDDKHANKTFYDGMCKENILNADLTQGRNIYNSFFKAYGTVRSMSVSIV